MMYKVSDCCGASPIGNGDMSFEDIGICSDCRDHCEYIYEDQCQRILCGGEIDLVDTCRVFGKCRICGLLHIWEKDGWTEVEDCELEEISTPETLAHHLYPDEKLSPICPRCGNVPDFNFRRVSVCMCCATISTLRKIRHIQTGVEFQTLICNGWV